MSAIAMFNIVLLVITYKILQKRINNYSPLVQFVRKRQFALTTIYTLGCGFRSIIPRDDVNRLVLFNHWISAVVIGRSVATVAELSFVAQWAFILYEIGNSTGNRFILSASKIIVPLIVLAECFSWYACTTGNFLGTTFEESLWAITATITLCGFITARPLYSKQQKNFITGAIVTAIGYVIYMVTIDVPNYIRSYMANQAAGKHYATVQQGFYEVATQWRVTHAYADWKYSMVWMTLYFSVAVWISLYIVNAPALDSNISFYKREGL